MNRNDLRLQIARAKIELAFVGGGERQIGRDEIALSRFKARGQVIECIRIFDFEHDIEVAAELPHEFVLGPGRPIDAEVKAAGGIAREQLYAAALLHLLELAGPIVPGIQERQRHHAHQQNAQNLHHGS